MLKNIAVAAVMALFIAASIPAGSGTLAPPKERSFPSTVGEVLFQHQMHAKDLSIKCVECHHSTAAKKPVTPHPDYLKSASINCEMCHGNSEPEKKNAYTCVACHNRNPMNIADETLSAKVAVHKQCWKCHPVGTGKDASEACKKCHSGKKTF